MDESFETEDFVEPHLCKMGGILRSRVLRVLRGIQYDKSDNILRHLAAVEVRGVSVYGVLNGGIAGGQQRSSTCLMPALGRLA